MITEIDMIEATEDAITTDNVTTEIVTETIAEEIALNPTLIQDHHPKATIVVIERKRSKEKDVLEAE